MGAGVSAGCLDKLAKGVYTKGSATPPLLVHRGMEVVIMSVDGVPRSNSEPLDPQLEDIYLNAVKPHPYHCIIPNQEDTPRTSQEAESQRVLESIGGLGILCFRRDELSGGYYASDQGGFVLTRREYTELGKRLRLFWNHYGDDEIDAYNARVYAELFNDRRQGQPKDPPGSAKSPQSPCRNHVKPLGFVYFIRADNGLFKIGMTANLKARVNAICSSSPVPAALYGYIESDRYADIEAELHAELSGSRLNGEWFGCDVGVVDDLLARYGGTANDH